MYFQMFILCFWSLAYEVLNIFNSLIFCIDILLFQKDTNWRDSFEVLL